MLKSKSIIAIFSLLLFSAITMAQGSIVYLNPSTGSDTNNGSLLSPYKTFEKALSVSIGEAEIYVTGSPISLSDGSVVDGILSGATTLTVRPNDGYSGSLFAVASNASVIMKNITLAGNGLTNQTVLMLSAGSSLSIEGDFFVKLMGNISLTLTTNPIEFTIAPSVSTTYNIQTVYGVFPDNNGRPLIDESNLNDDCLSYFLNSSYKCNFL